MKVLLVSAAGLLAASMLAAPGAGAAGRPKPKYNPNQVICESRTLIGSRLKRVRVCHTAAEWEDVRTEEKVGLMRKQYNGSPGSGVIANDSPN